MKNPRVIVIGVKSSEEHEIVAKEIVDASKHHTFIQSAFITRSGLDFLKENILQYFEFQGKTKEYINIVPEYFILVVTLTDPGADTSKAFITKTMIDSDKIDEAYDIERNNKNGWSVINFPKKGFVVAGIKSVPTLTEFYNNLIGEYTNP